MSNYQKLGFNSQEEYNNYFIETLLPTNHNFSFFVDWNKVYRNVEIHLYEIGLLNSLNHMSLDNIEQNFRRLITSNPEIVPVLPSILAIRFQKTNTNVEIFDMEYKNYDFNPKTFNEDDIVEFCRETGIFELFSNIKDLKAYLLGTEVGLDTNARKNRSGKSFENIISKFLQKKLRNYSNFTFAEQVNVKEILRTKYADFVIYEGSKPKIIIECNFYNSYGSKPIETGNAYIHLQQEIKESGMIFLWISDGSGWIKMNNTLYELMPQIDYFMNYTMFAENIEKILNLI